MIKQEAERSSLAIWNLVSAAKYFTPFDPPLAVLPKGIMKNNPYINSFLFFLHHCQRRQRFVTAVRFLLCPGLIWAGCQSHEHRLEMQQSQAIGSQHMTELQQQS